MKYVALIVTGLLCIASASPVWATHEITWYVIGAGGMGGASVGGHHSIVSTMGQPVVGPATGDHHTIYAGFWWWRDATSAVEEGQQEIMPTIYLLRRVAPNPAGGQVSIDFDVPLEGSETTLRAYNVQGGVVRTLVQGIQAAGRRNVVWDGRDDEGRALPSGVYFIRMDAPGYQTVKKVLLLQ